MKTYHNALLTPATRLGSWPMQMMIRQPPGILGDPMGVTLFSSTPTNFPPLLAWNSYRPLSPPTITYVQAPFGQTHSASNHGEKKPIGRYQLVTETLLPRPSMSGPWYDNRPEEMQRSFLPHRQDRPSYKELRAVLWNNPHNIREMRDEGVRDHGPRLSPEDTVLKQLDREIRRLSIVLEIIDMKDHMLALHDKLKADSAKIQELSRGLELN